MSSKHFVKLDIGGTTFKTSKSTSTKFDGMFKTMLETGVPKNRSAIMSSENIVKLDIGGTVFKTSKSTLTKFEGMFKTMLETSIPVKKDKFDCIFIDRSPKHFDLILNFMRDGRVELPDSIKELKEIENEVQYYLLTDLVELCNAKIPATTIVSKKINVIESDSEYLQIVTSPIKPVLIIYYTMNPNGTITYPDEFDARSFLEKHKSRLDIYFKQNKSEDYFWSWSLHKDNKRHEDSMFGEKLLFTEAIEYSIHYFFKCVLCI